MAKVRNSKKVPPAAMASFERISTGIPGLDAILHGGFLSGGTYLLVGAPGTGKTVLSNQMSFHQVGNGGRALYVTLLAENHARMFGNLNELTFFDQQEISNGIQYVSGYKVLEEKGLDGLLRLLNDLVLRYKSTLVFIDGVASADALSGSPENFKRFVHSLNTVLGITGCTTFLLSSMGSDDVQPEHTMVDGIVRMTMYDRGMRTVREIEVRKFRGSNHLQGRHFYEISETGLSVYPRIEALLNRDRNPALGMSKRHQTGIPGLDDLIGGGCIPTSVTALLGPAGAGKTTIGTSFLETGASIGESGLFVSFYEHPSRLVEKQNLMGKKFGTYVKNGKIRVLRFPPGDNIIDKFIHQILFEISEFKIKRIFIDGVGGFRDKMVSPDRLLNVMSTFTQELRYLNVTSLITDETDLLKSNFEGVLSNSSAFSDNIVELRHVLFDGVQTQVLCITKTRDSMHDSTAYLVKFEKNKMKIGPKVTYVEPYLPAVELASDRQDLQIPKNRKTRGK